MPPYLLLSVAIAAEVLATSALRASQGMTRPGPALVVVAGYAVAFFLISRVLLTLPLGVTYAIWSGVGTAATALIGWLYFRDAFSWTALGGIGLIIAGVAVLNLKG